MEDDDDALPTVPKAKGGGGGGSGRKVAASVVAYDNDEDDEEEEEEGASLPQGTEEQLMPAAGKRGSKRIRLSCPRPTSTPTTPRRRGRCALVLPKDDSREEGQIDSARQVSLSR